MTYLTCRSDSSRIRKESPARSTHHFRPERDRDRDLSDGGSRDGIQTELALARRVQQRLLPQGAKTLARLRCLGTCIPAGEVGGDYYDFIDIGEGSVGIVVADVSGKGVAGALLAAALQAYVRGEFARGRRPISTILRNVNARFFDSTLPEQYATIFLARYDERARGLRYVNCGHPPGIVMRTDGSVERLQATAPPLGMFARWDCEEYAITLQPNDTVWLCSDGITDGGENGEESDEQRLLWLLRSNRHRDIHVTAARVLRELRPYRSGAVSDDATIVGVQAFEAVTECSKRAGS